MTGRVRKLLKRSRAERRLLAHALLLHVAVALALKCVRFSRLCRWGARLYAGRVADRCDAAREDAVIWAVTTAATIIPFEHSCLSEALAAHWLLAACGRASLVRIGVAPTPRQPLVAHAWLESQGRAIMGLPAETAYLPLS